MTNIRFVENPNLKDPKKLQKALKELIETLKKNNKEFAEVEAILLS